MHNITIPGGAYLAADGETLIDANGKPLDKDKQAAYAKLRKQSEAATNQAVKVDLAYDNAEVEALRRRIAELEVQGPKRAKTNVVEDRERRIGEAQVVFANDQASAADKDAARKTLDGFGVG